MFPYLFLLTVSQAVEFSCPPGNRVMIRRGVVGRRRRRFGLSNSKCVECEPGKYMNLYHHAETQCYPCQPPQWQDQSGASECKVTPGSVTVCPVGKWGLPGATLPGTPCHACAPGKYQTNSGQGMCHLCVAGMYQDTAGSPSCQAGNGGMCAPGKYGHVGATSSAEADTCFQCEAGRFQAHPGQDSCQACERGTYQLQVGTVACDSIPTCQRFYYFDQTRLSCRSRHDNLVWLAVLGWTGWVLSLAGMCSGPNTHGGWFIGYNFIVCLAIGIESCRPGGPMSESSFWTMVGFLGISMAGYLGMLLTGVRQCAAPRWRGLCYRPRGTVRETEMSKV